MLASGLASGILGLGKKLVGGVIGRGVLGGVKGLAKKAFYYFVPTAKAISSGLIDRVKGDMSQLGNTMANTAASLGQKAMNDVGNMVIDAGDYASNQIGRLSNKINSYAVPVNLRDTDTGQMYSRAFKGVGRQQTDFGRAPYSMPVYRGMSLGDSYKEGLRRTKNEFMGINDEGPTQGQYTRDYQAISQTMSDPMNTMRIG